MPATQTKWKQKLRGSAALSPVGSALWRVCVCVCVCARARARKRDRDRERHRNREQTESVGARSCDREENRERESNRPAFKRCMASPSTATALSVSLCVLSRLAGNESGGAARLARQS